MKISKISSNTEWLEGFVLPTIKTAATAPAITSAETSSPEDVSPLSPEAVDETVLAFECDKIEKCASSNKPYFYNKAWSQESVSHLKEYASVVGLPEGQFIPAEYSAPVKTETIKVASANTTTKTAEATTPSKAKLDLGDPFKFEEKIAAASREKRDWQVNTPSQKLELNPVMTGGIVPVRGGENYNIQNTPKLASNQNSLANPKAIENLAESTDLDNGARLAKEREERIAGKKQEKKQWEQDIIDAMPHRDIVAHGKVFPTEMLNAQPGLGSPASRRVAGNFDPANMPEKTAGEMLGEQNKARHDAISRPKVESDWQEAAKGAAMRGISDSFTESLKKAMGR